MPKRILIVSFYYPPEIGAAPTRIANLAEGLSTLGNEVDILTCLPNYPKGKIFPEYRDHFHMQETSTGHKIDRYWTYTTISKNPIKRGISMLSFATILWHYGLNRKRIKNYDIIIVQSPPLPVAVSAIKLFKGVYKKTVIVNISDLWPLSAIELGAMKPSGKLYEWFSWMERFVYRHTDGILGQSQEIIEHIEKFQPSVKSFLYRNLKETSIVNTPRKRNGVLKIVYAGLLGVAQDLFGIITNIDFKEEGIELHLYGGGNQASQIENYILNHPDSNVFYHGYISKERLMDELKQYDASIVPLAKHIQGAVPSKIFDLLPVGVPVLFCGSGEGADIIKNLELGFVSPSSDYMSLVENLRILNSLSSEAYTAISKNCIEAANNQFSFASQMRQTQLFLDSFE